MGEFLSEMADMMSQTNSNVSLASPMHIPTDGWSSKLAKKIHNLKSSTFTWAIAQVWRWFYRKMVRRASRSFNSCSTRCSKGTWKRWCPRLSHFSVTTIRIPLLLRLWPPTHLAGLVLPRAINGTPWRCVGGTARTPPALIATSMIFAWG